MTTTTIRKAYVQNAIKTEKYNNKISTVIGEKHTRLLHSIMGLVTELREINELQQNLETDVYLMQENPPHEIYTKELSRLIKEKDSLLGREEEEEKYVDNHFICHLLEEIGDCFWYIAIACDVLEINFDNMISKIELSFFGQKPAQIEDSLNALSHVTSKMLDYYKKYLFYGKEYNTDNLKIMLESTTSHLYNILRQERHDDFELRYVFDDSRLLDYILNCNIEKLKQRYPEAYL